MSEGTRFRLFPQLPLSDDDNQSEVVAVSIPAGEVQTGPSDDRMYTVYPIGKDEAYGAEWGTPSSPLLYLPPWDGDIQKLAESDAHGHFDSIEIDTPQFQSAHLYGSVRWVLDIWERYFGEDLQWHFARDYERMELSILPELDNAQIGYGFLEVGAHHTDDGDKLPFSLNFDVVAHEVGHAIIYSKVGIPNPSAEQAEYFGFHESAADLVALISLLHFEIVLDDLLDNTRGNLYTLNRLNRFAELSRNEQIRLAANPLVMSNFIDGWEDEHDLAQPLTGAMFDILVDIFHECLLSAGLLTPYVEDLADQVEYRPEHTDLIQAYFDEAYEGNALEFRQALIDARDTMGTYLADTWNQLSPDYLNYDDVGRVLIDVDQKLLGGRYESVIVNNLRLREIGAVTVGPRLNPPGVGSHVMSSRTAVPNLGASTRRLSYWERMQLKNSG